MGEVDTELQEADELARDADITIREVNGRVTGNPAVERSENLFWREFAAAMRRYCSEDGDRAVAGVKTRFEESSIEAADRYATYDACSRQKRVRRQVGCGDDVASRHGGFLWSLYRVSGSRPRSCEADCLGCDDFLRADDDRVLQRLLLRRPAMGAIRGGAGKRARGDGGSGLVDGMGLVRADACG